MTKIRNRDRRDALQSAVMTDDQYEYADRPNLPLKSFKDMFSWEPPENSDDDINEEE